MSLVAFVCDTATVLGIGASVDIGVEFVRSTLSAKGFAARVLCFSAEPLRCGFPLLGLDVLPPRLRGELIGASALALGGPCDLIRLFASRGRLCPAGLFPAPVRPRSHDADDEHHRYHRERDQKNDHPRVHLMAPFGSAAVNRRPLSISRTLLPGSHARQSPRVATTAVGTWHAMRIGPIGRNYPHG